MHLVASHLDSNSARSYPVLLSSFRAPTNFRLSFEELSQNCEDFFTFKGHGKGMKSGERKNKKSKARKYRMMRRL